VWCGDDDAALRKWLGSGNRFDTPQLEPQTSNKATHSVTVSASGATFLA
jgi:hypothetical protein